MIRNLPDLIAVADCPMTKPRRPICEAPPFAPPIRRLVRTAFAENTMSEPFVCECIFVEARNRRDARSGCIEYRAQTCPTCRHLDARLLAGSTTAALFDSSAPKYQTLH